MLNLKDSVNPIYSEAIKQNQLREFLIPQADFPVACFENFLKEDVFEQIRERAVQSQVQSSSSNVGAARRASVEWGPYFDSTGIRLMCGKDAQAFLSGLFGKKFRLRRNWVPQFAKFAPKSGGFDCHNDRDEPRDLVMLFYLTDEYPDQGGGALQIHNKNKEIVFKIAPKKNTLVTFEVSDHSWHSIEDMSGNWVRKNILFDWEYANEF